jgi:hypothetical protein
MRLVPKFAVTAPFVFATVLGCGTAEPQSSEEVQSSPQVAELRDSGGSLLFAPDSRPYGVSMERWSELIWKWIYRQPTGSNPLLDLTGASCGVDQEGPVWFLPSVIPGAPVFQGERSCTIPHQRALLVQTAGFLNDYPCPDPTFQPAPGQSLYDFLIGPASAFIDTVYFFEVTLDGVPQPDMLRFRLASKDLFQVRGDLSLQTTLDGCITGRPQPAVADGYVFMVKPLARGEHTLVWHTRDSFGMTGDTTLTYRLTVR